MSAEPSIEIPGRLLRSGLLRRRHSSTFTTSLDRAAHSVARPSLLGSDDLERTVRRSPRPVAQCRWLPANVKGSFVHRILVHSAQLRRCMQSRYKKLQLILTLALTKSIDSSARSPID